MYTYINDFFGQHLCLSREIDVINMSERDIFHINQQLYYNLCNLMLIINSYFKKYFYFTNTVWFDFITIITTVIQN